MDGNREFWGYLIKPDKTASPRLEQLCLGLVKIIRAIEPSSDTELTPKRLAAFYHSVGGNYNSLFLESEDASISFMYRVLGCFHSLQPTSNPFDTPTIPCLTPVGFIRWVTIQILLTPEEQVQFLRKAVQIYNVPRPEGGTFPKTIPDEAFPSKPDEPMEKWYMGVASGLNQQHHTHRLQETSYTSPQPSEPREKRDGYFAFGEGQGRRISRTIRFDSPDENQPTSPPARRGSSVPKIVAPPAADRIDRTDRTDRSGRSQSAQRDYPPRQRSQTTTAGVRPFSEAGKRRSQSPTNRQHAGVQADRYHNYPSPLQMAESRRSSNSGKSPVFGSGSEASSEDSHPLPYRNRKSDEEKPVKFTKLLVPSFLKPKRRHSSEPKEPKHRYIEPTPTLPARPEIYSQQSPRISSMPIGMQSPRQPARDNVRLNDGIFGDGGRPRSTIENYSTARPGSGRYQTGQPIIGPTPPNSAPPAVGTTTPREGMNAMASFGPQLNNESSSGSNHSNGRRPITRTRRDGGIARVNTVTGVKGRDYPDNEPASRHRNRRSERFSFAGEALPTTG